MTIPFLSVDQIIERAIIMLQADERVRNSPVLDSSNQPISINRIRQFDGFDDNQTGLTLSIFPYSYHGTSNETIGSKNAALVYDDYELGSTVNTARERCRLSLVVTLQTLGFAQDAFTAPTAGQIQVLRSEKERALYRWLTIVWDILLRNPLSNLGGLVHASRIHWGGFHSTQWDAKKGDAVLHKAAILWQLELYTVRNFQSFVKVQTVPDVGSQLTWTYVGVRMSDGTPIYWDSYYNCLMTVLGIPLFYTPKGQSVQWDLKNQRFFDPTTFEPLSYVETEDTNLKPVQAWVNTNLVLVGVLRPSNKNLFWNLTLKVLQLYDGTVITTLEDGTPIYYNPGINQIVTDPGGTDPLLPGPSYISVKTGEVNIYDANFLDLRDSFLF